ncbi:hypothetical protein L914_02746 [Phytophthora nicotianae]|uniref:RxLR effector protein n=1 Tax=Phytophthora nicotianae TaxID=4792 RepID=W2P0R3_PHYNI|nr:hypothetical protein L914_02746 [Phytophthora nicotianae]
MLQAAENIPSTKHIASELQADLFKTWLNERYTPDSIVSGFGSFRLRDNPSLLNVVMVYMKDFNNEYPEKATTLLPLLRNNHFDDRDLTNLMETASKSPATEDIAKVLQTKRLQSWIAEMKPPSAVFLLLNMERTDGFVDPNTLASFKFKAFAKYAEMFNKKNPTKTESLMSQLVFHYGNWHLRNMIVVGLRDPSTATIAAKLEAMQFDHCLMNHYPPDEVFKAVIPNHPGENIFNVPVFKIWVKYLDDYSATRPEMDKYTLITILRNRFSDFKLKQMVKEAIENPSTVDIARRVNAQLRHYTGYTG